MRTILTIIFSTLLLSVYSQTVGNPTLLTILGRYNYKKIPIGYGLKILFQEDPTKCDPVKGFIPIADQIKHFRESLIAIGIDPGSMLEIKNYVYSEYKKQEFKMSVPDFSKFLEIISLSNRQLVQITGTFYAYKEKKFEDEDASAISALQNANQKASVIAEHLGMRIHKILNVDDDTRVPSIYSPAEPRDWAAYNRIVEMLSRYEGESFMDNTIGTYTLRVIYELTE